MATIRIEPVTSGKRVIAVATDVATGATLFSSSEHDTWKHAVAAVEDWARSKGHRYTVTDASGYVTARATVVEFRPPAYPLAYDISDAAGGGRFVVHPDDLRRVKLYEGYTVRFYPADQFARLVEGDRRD